MSVAFKGSNESANKKGGQPHLGTLQTKKYHFTWAALYIYILSKNDNNNFIVNCHDNEYDNDKKKF